MRTKAPPPSIEQVGKRFQRWRNSPQSSRIPASARCSRAAGARRLRGSSPPFGSCATRANGGTAPLAYQQGQNLLSANDLTSAVNSGARSTSACSPESRAAANTAFRQGVVDQPVSQNPERNLRQAVTLLGAGASR
jgi:hypothetical protein